MDEENISSKAVLSMLLEVSANPKPGNVDRFHNFDDLKYEHFLVSASSAFPVFLRIAENRVSIGRGVYDLVATTREWHEAGNVHFGAFLLLTPLVYSGGDVDEAFRAVRDSTYEDSLWVKRAFDMSEARVMKAEKLDLVDDVEEEIVREKLNLYDWMKLAPEENFIAKEYVSGFELCNSGKEMLLSYHSETGDVNQAIVLTYMSFLAELPDPLIVAKKGMDEACRVKALAEEAMNVYRETENFAVFEELDVLLISEGINPGSVADLTIASIFLALVEGWRF
ncbi:triphosphoribosyl-dephospho-CoA synthase [Geoglobus acetivorans]|uniref:Triphosphoribosyl-dephospho-CoA synthetase n=1 Tax=Geoglobus acetivorans TaxID=565033 RepID=A0A0A7GAT8_GEOAI|nr:Triphosphoribosyl-dephospho-CoA synthetase [Geoglobus acetivorans]